MIRRTPDFPANPADPRAAFPVRMVVTSVVCALFTSAFVLAQDPKPAMPAVKAAAQKYLKPDGFVVSIVKPEKI